MNYNYSVYWAHYEGETNPRKEGYIGITTRKLYLRKNSHRRNPRLEMRELANDKTAVWQVLHSNLSKHEAQMIETFYRPTEGIGMNNNKGGKNYYPKRQRGAKRTVINRYTTSPFFIDDREFSSKQQGVEWLVKNNICSNRTAQRRVANKTRVSLSECRRKR